MGMKISSIIGAILFAGFASLQTNDVAQYNTAEWIQQAWLFGYAAVALLSIYNVFKYVPSKVFYAIGFISLGLTILRATQIHWELPLFCFLSPDDPANQNPAGNETGGLALVTLWTFIMAYLTQRQNAKSAAIPAD